MPPSVAQASVSPQVRTGAATDPPFEEMLAGLPERLGPIPRSRAFRIRLWLCAATLAALLLIYVALVVVTSYGVWSHIASPGVVAAAHAILPVEPLFVFLCVAGPILCVFLVKPLFTLRTARTPSVRLKRSDEPRLFAFVDRLCAAEGAPAPSEILVDTQVNASASLRHGLIGLFRDDLTLTIGLPLARAMTIREFTGVLAHEFGHFAHGRAMRLSSLVRRSIFLMLKIVHERDWLDAILIKAGAIRIFLDPRLLIASLAFSLFIWSVLGLLWLARMLLKGLAWVGMASAGALLREMEYDADLHEARLVGCETFVGTGDRLLALNAGRGAAMGIEQRCWAARMLPDDLPELVAILAGRLSAKPDSVRELREEAMKAITGRFDSHPAMRDREAAVHRATFPGIFRLESPASSLFSDIDALSREATQVVYRDVLGMEFKTARLLPVAEILRHVEGDPSFEKRLSRLTQGCPSEACRVVIGPMHDAGPTEDPPCPGPLAQELDLSRRRILELAPGAALAARRLDEARLSQDRYRVVSSLMRTGFPVDPGPHGDSITPREAVAEGLKRAAREIHEAEGELSPFSEAVSHRLRVALRLLPGADLPAPGPDVHAGCEAMVAALDGLGSARIHVELLRSRVAVLLGILREAQRERGNSLSVRPVFEASDGVREAIHALLAAIDRTAYPFPLPAPEAHTTTDRPTVGAFLGRVPHGEDPAEVYATGSDLLRRLRMLEDRLLSSLAEVAEQVEATLGLSLLPDAPA